MKLRKSGFICLVIAALLVFAVVISGGCGGSGGGDVAIPNNTNNNTENNTDDNNNNGDNDQESYTNEITKKIVAESTVYSLTDFLADKSQIVRKGDVLLYILDDNHSIGTISENTEHLTRIN